MTATPDHPPVTDHFTTVTPCRGGWLATEYRDGHRHQTDTRPTEAEANALATQWREDTP